MSSKIERFCDRNFLSILLIIAFGGCGIALIGVIFQECSK